MNAPRRRRAPKPPPVAALPQEPLAVTWADSADQVHGIALRLRNDALLAVARSMFATSWSAPAPIRIELLAAASRGIATHVLSVLSIVRPEDHDMIRVLAYLGATTGALVRGMLAVVEDEAARAQS